jgi:YD repeat-containing protein
MRSGTLNKLFGLIYPIRRISIVSIVYATLIVNVFAQNYIPPPYVVPVTAPRPSSPTSQPSSFSFPDVSWSYFMAPQFPAAPPVQPGIGTSAPTSTCSSRSPNPVSVNPKSHNPVVLATGTKYLSQGDFSHASMLGMPLTRIYQSENSGASFFGRHWASTLDYEPIYMYGNWRLFNVKGAKVGLPDYINVRLPDGSAYQFTHFLDPGSTSLVYFTPANYSSANTQATGVGMGRLYAVYEDKDHIKVLIGNREYLYSSSTTTGSVSALLDSIRENGTTIYTYTRDEAGRVLSIKNALGAQVKLDWAGGKTVNSVTAPDGSVWSYGYDANGMLNRVVPPQSVSGIYTYFYEDPVNNTLLTGFAVDGVRRTRYVYDGTGKVVKSGFENGEMTDTFSYSATSTVLTDVRGQKTTYNFQTVKGQKVLASTQTTATAHCPSASASQSYDSEGFLSQSIDFRGIKTRYTFDKDGLLLTKTIAADTAEAYTTTNSYVRSSINRVGDLVKVTTTGADGRGILQVDYTYVDTLMGRQIATVTLTDLLTGSAQRSQTISYTSHANGGIHSKSITTKFPNGTATEIYYYDAAGNVTNYINALGHTTTYGNYNGLGMPRHVTDPNGLVMTIDYDGRSNPVFTSTPGRTSKTSTFAGDGQLLTTFSSDGSASQYFYNSAGRLIEIADATGKRRRLNFDVTSNTRTVQSPRDTPSATSAALTAVSSPEPFSAATVYDYALNLPAKIHGNRGQVTSFFYDANGNFTTISDATGHLTTYTYDAQNRPLIVNAPDGGQTILGYDPAGQLSSVRDPRGLVTTYGYNGFGDRVRTTSPDTGTTTYTYDIAGRLETETFADGRVTIYTWDALGRLVSKRNGGSINTYIYDEGAYGKGLITRMQDYTGETAYTYSATGELLRQTNNIFGQVFHTTWTYDNAGRKETMTYPSGMMLKYTYDAAGRISAIKSNGIR